MSPEQARARGLTSTVTFPSGNLAPEGSVIKSTAIDPSVVDADGVYRKTGPARVFTSEKAAIAAIKSHGPDAVRAGDVLVLICRGPMGSGMEETYQITSGAEAHQLGQARRRADRRPLLRRPPPAPASGTSAPRPWQAGRSASCATATASGSSSTVTGWKARWTWSARATASSGRRRGRGCWRRGPPAPTWRQTPGCRPTPGCGRGAAGRLRRNLGGLRVRRGRHRRRPGPPGRTAGIIGKVCPARRPMDPLSHPRTLALGGPNMDPACSPRPRWLRLPRWLAAGLYAGVPLAALGCAGGAFLAEYPQVPPPPAGERSAGVGAGPRARARPGAAGGAGARPAGGARRAGRPARGAQGGADHAGRGAAAFGAAQPTDRSGPRAAAREPVDLRPGHQGLAAQRLRRHRLLPPRGRHPAVRRPAHPLLHRRLLPRADDPERAGPARGRLPDDRPGAPRSARTRPS